MHRKDSGGRAEVVLSHSEVVAGMASLQNLTVLLFSSVMLGSPLRAEKQEIKHHVEGKGQCQVGQSLGSSWL